MREFAAGVSLSDPAALDGSILEGGDPGILEELEVFSSLWVIRNFFIICVSSNNYSSTSAAILFLSTSNSILASMTWLLIPVSLDITW